MNVQTPEGASFYGNFLSGRFSVLVFFVSEHPDGLTGHKYLLIPPQTLPLAHYEIYAIRFPVYEKRSRHVLQSLHCSAIATLLLAIKCKNWNPGDEI